MNTIYSEPTERILDGIVFPMVKGRLKEFFVDIGGRFGGLATSNTLFLAKKFGWFGHIIDYTDWFEWMVEYCEENRLHVHIERRWVTAENINELVSSNGFDLLSIDIDGNDYWIWKAIKARPAVVIIEYNAHKEGEWVVPYDPNFVERSGDLKIYGASKESLIKLGDEKGYELVAIEEPSNLFFVERGRM